MGGEGSGRKAGDTLLVRGGLDDEEIERRFGPIPEGVMAKRFRKLRPINFKEWGFYSLFHLPGMTLKEAQETMGISRSAANAWQNEGWFIKMQDDLIDRQQRRYLGQLSSGVDRIVDGMMHVADSRDAKTANARVALGGRYAEMGKNPIIDKRPRVSITHNTQLNTLNIDSGKFREMSKEELFEFARTGKRPEQIGE